MREEFSEAQDRFRYVVECPQMYHSISDTRDCIRFFEQAIARLTATERLDTRLGILYAQRIQVGAGCKDMLPEVDELASLAPAGSLTRLRARLLRGSIQSIEPYPELLGELLALREDIQQVRDTFLLALINKVLGLTCMFLGRHAEAREFMTQALRMFGDGGHAVSRAIALNDLGVLEKRMGNYEEARTQYAISLSESTRLGLLWGAKAAAANLCILHIRTGPWDRALDYYHNARKINQQIVSDVTDVTFGWENLYLLLGRMRRFDEAIPPLEDICDTLDLRGRVVAHNMLGELYTEMGKLEDAEAHLDTAHELAKGSAPGGDIAVEVLRRQGQLYHLQGRHDDAKEKLLECIRRCHATADRYEVGAALRTLAELHAMNGHERKAMVCYGISYYLLEELQAKYELMFTNLSLARFTMTRVPETPEQERGQLILNALEHLRNARSLCTLLDLNYYEAHVTLLMAECAWIEGDTPKAQALVDMAESNGRGLEHPVDRELIAAAVDFSALRMGLAQTLGENVSSVERRMIDSALRRHHGNRQRAADELGIPRSTLIDKIKRLEM